MTTSTEVTVVKEGRRGTDLSPTSIEVTRRQAEIVGL